MPIVLIDDGRAYDGHTARSHPLGGPERALISLAEALAKVRQPVIAYTRTPITLTAHGVEWRPIPAGWTYGPLCAEAALVVAFRDPRLLGCVAAATCRTLWTFAPIQYLEDAPYRPAVTAFQPRIIVPGEVARFAAAGEDVSVIPPGVESWFHPRGSDADAPAPVAITTTHPMNGLADVLDGWRTTIAPAVPNARLHIYSALLWRALRGQPVDRDIAALAETTLGVDGSEVKTPLPAPAMAEVYRAARVHLYPGHPRDLVCWTLADSQACGLPAVALSRGACGECLQNGESGYLVPDMAALANVAVQCLGEDSVWRSLHNGTRLHRNRPTWAASAGCFLNFLQ